MVVGEGQVDEQDLAREPLGQRGRHVHGYGRPTGASLGRVDGYGRSSLLRRHHACTGDEVGQGVLALLDELGELDQGVGFRRHRLVQGLPVEGEQPAVLERTDARRARLFRDQCHLAEEIVRSHQRDGDGVAGRLLDVHLAAARLDDEHGVAWVALVNDHRALGGRGGGEAPRQGVEDVVRQREEDRDSFQDLEASTKVVRRA